MKSNESINEFKPRKWLLIILIIIAIAISVVLAYKVITNIKKSIKENGSGNIFEISTGKRTFNNRFEIYSGSKYCSSASSLLDAVIKNNKTNEKHLIEVTFGETTTTDPEELKSLKKNYETFDKCEISIDYDDGLVSKITIEITEKDQSKVKSYNVHFENRTGTVYGNQVTYLLDDVITNNKTKEDHILTVVFGSTSTTDPEEIKNLKKSFDSWTQYEVSVDYDKDGYINKIIIEQ